MIQVIDPDVDSAERARYITSALEGAEFNPRDRAVESELERLRRGDPSAIYAELHAIATRHMSRQDAAHTLQPTALVNEAFAKLWHGGEANWTDRAHFLSVASVAMRQILVDHARRKRASKRGSQPSQVPIDRLVAEFERRSCGMLELDDALERLRERDAGLAKLVELRFFGGQSIADVARVLEISERQVRRRWSVARAWLRTELTDD